MAARIGTTALIAICNNDEVPYMRRINLDFERR